MNEINVCEWCGMKYPKGGYDYYSLVLFGKEEHTICGDCYEHLKKIESKK